jgi:catechol 2,3-dioxygenase-like lactoylglutathione lyase family enzyme
MLDHISIIVTDYPASKEFYTAALGSIGGKMMMEFGPDVTKGPWVSGWGRDEPTFWFATCTEGTKPTPVHVAFKCPNHASVDAFHAAALKAGAKCNGAPGLRPLYGPDYYGAFVIDRDGHRLEAVCHVPAK